MPPGRPGRGLGEVREASQRWLSGDLIFLDAHGQEYAIDFPREVYETELLAVGVTRAGRVVTFRSGAGRVEVVPLPATGAHGRIVDWVVVSEAGRCANLRVEGAHSWSCLRADRSAMVSGELPWWRSDPSPEYPAREPWSGTPLESRGIEDIAPQGESRICLRDATGIRCTSRGRPGEYDVATGGPPGGAAAMAVGRCDLCARSREGGWWCARCRDEDNPDRGPWSPDRRRPERVRGLEGARRLYTRFGEVCAVREGAAPLCHGVEYGGDIEASRHPRAPADDVVAASPTCEVRRDGAVRCEDVDGFTGVVSGAVRREIGDVVAIDGARRRPVPCVLGSAGRVACARRGGSDFAVVPGLTDAVLVRSGTDLGCALRRDGRVVCWGRNAGGMLTARAFERAPPLAPFAR